jgi:hypothetical protein
LDMTISTSPCLRVEIGLVVAGFSRTSVIRSPQAEVAKPLLTGLQVGAPMSALGGKLSLD